MFDSVWAVSLEHAKFDADQAVKMLDALKQSPALSLLSWICIKPSKKGNAVYILAQHDDCLDQPDERTRAIADAFSIPTEFQIPSQDESAPLQGIELLYTMPGPSPFANSNLSLETDIDADSIPLARSKLQQAGLLLLNIDVSSQLPLLHAAAMRRIAWAETCLYAGAVDVGNTSFRYLEMSSREKQRFDLLFAADDPAICKFERTAPWLPLIRDILGQDCQCQVSVVYSKPGAGEQTWHADGPHLGASATDRQLCNHSEPYALCVFLPLIALDTTVGFTQFWPESHRYSHLLGFGGVAALTESTVDGLGPLGSALVYDYRLVHRGMPNTSKTTIRPVLQFLYHKPTYKEKWNYGDASLATLLEADQQQI
eukprot:TRINITY_DN11154_c0_g1_i1.p1 TRINITY_DN11154_c0_g1~~TRINITY_DN11154_c0_g1_i1.p1  ORF type:complete len:370 (+),score=55.36 TRINITY_DN11154_c0_g1_i1:1608-2717(+)